MNGLPYYKAYPRDFLDGTAGMDFEVKGAYRILLDLIYMHGGRLVDEPRFIAGHLGCSVKKWNGLRTAILATGKISVSGGYLGNLRADKELDSLKSFYDKQRENGSKPKQNKDLAKATAEPNANHTEPEPEPVKETEAKASEKKNLRGSRLPADWRLPKAWGEWAVTEGMSEPTVRRQSERFRDYWIGKAGKDGAKLDWEATWRNWVRKHLDESRSGGRQSDDQFGAFGKIRSVG